VSTASLNGAQLGRLARAVLPPRVASHVIGLGNWLRGESEIRLLRALCDPERDAVDVGANWGAYTYWLSRWARRCHAFEPHPSCAAFLLRAFPRLDVQQVALSNATSDEAILHVPLWQGHFVEAGGFLANSPRDLQTQFVSVRTRRLDDYRFVDVGFIKIDVEGHELAVIEGGLKTLERSRPRILVECEERHRTSALASVLTVLIRLGYQGMCLATTGLVPFANAPEAQSSALTNNFLFVHTRDPIMVTGSEHVAAHLSASAKRAVRRAARRSALRTPSPQG
jgi:FkbM family methyltransferase